MEQTQSQKQPPIVSSIPAHRKPFSDLTNRRHRHTSSFSQSKKPKPSAVTAISDSSTRSTQNPNLLTPKPPTPDDWVRVGNRITRSQSNTMLKIRSKKKDAADAIHFEKTKNEPKKSKYIMEEDVRTPLSGTEIHDVRKPIANGQENALQSKSLTDPLPNNKRRKCSSTESSGKYVVPQDFIDQQRAYFEEIDGYELQVEEVESNSEDEE